MSKQNWVFGTQGRYVLLIKCMYAIGGAASRNVGDLLQTHSKGSLCALTVSQGSFPRSCCQPQLPRMPARAPLFDMCSTLVRLRGITIFIHNASIAARNKFSNSHYFLTGKIMNLLSKIAIAAVSLSCLSGQVLAQSPYSAHEHSGELPAPKFDAKGIARTETVRTEFDSNRQAIQVRVDFAQGASFPKHSHPGVEIAYVLSGSIEYEMDGKTIRLQAGESLYIPAGAVHSAKNIGSKTTSELATYLVEKDKPIVVLAK